jgi:ferredoxin-NADP reductase
MREYVRILDIEPVAHNVKLFRVEKPTGFHFTPGQATDVSVDKPGMENNLHPFTFTSLNHEPFLEFTIKRYPDHHGITDLLHRLVPGDSLLIGEVWGAIEYKGPGYFLAGGAGITPFISIFRQLHEDGKLAGNTLIFANKTVADIIYEQELKDMLGEKAIFILSEEQKDGYLSGHIDEAFVGKNIHNMGGHFYVCGPDQMVKDLVKILETAGADIDTVVFEK